MDKKFKDRVRLTFVYDESKLTCDEKDLCVMRYDEEEQFYDILSDYEIDENKNTVTAIVDCEGTYVLEDSVIWVGVWNGTYVQEQILMEPDCHWHDRFYYEDIEKLADISIYDDSGEYHITTINELAGLVKLVNEGNAFDDCNFYLECDLDLEGYKWAPIGWYSPANIGYAGKDFPFNGHFYGNSHVIYNLTIDNPEQSAIGFFGRTLSSFTVADLGLVDCNIVGKYYIGGIVGDNINPGNYGMTNCFVVGHVSGQDYVGALVGSSAYIIVKDSYAHLYNYGVTEIVGSLRGGSLENCHINDNESKQKLAEYIK